MGYWVYFDHPPSGGGRVGGGGGGGGGLFWIAVIAALAAVGYLWWKFGFGITVIILLVFVGICGGFILRDDYLSQLTFWVGDLIVIAFVVLWMNFSFRGALATLVLAFCCYGGALAVLDGSSIVTKILGGALSLFLFVCGFPQFFVLIIKPLFHLA